MKIHGRNEYFNNGINMFNFVFIFMLICTYNDCTAYRNILDRRGYLRHRIFFKRQSTNFVEIWNLWTSYIVIQNLSLYSQKLKWDYFEYFFYTSPSSQQIITQNLKPLKVTWQIRNPPFKSKLFLRFRLRNA